MRKGYGPTGVSFNFTLREFERIIGEQAWITIELLIYGKTYKTTMHTSELDSPTKVRDLFYALDSAHIIEQSMEYHFKLVVTT